MPPEDVRRELGALAVRLVESSSLTEGLDPQARLVVARPQSAAFRVAVRRLYWERCAVCGSGLHRPDGEPEVEAAHIYPKALDGSDDVRNDVCLCRRHHWAFDAGWMAIADDLTVLIRADLPEDPGDGFVRAHAGCALRVPGDPTCAPHPEFLAAQRAVHGFA